MATILTVEAMHCQSCVRRVTNAIRSVAPDSKIEIDVPARRVVLDSAENLAQIEKALADAGYPAQLAV